MDRNNGTEKHSKNQNENVINYLSRENQNEKINRTNRTSTPPRGDDTKVKGHLISPGDLLRAGFELELDLGRRQALDVGFRFLHVEPIQGHHHL